MKTQTVQYVNFSDWFEGLSDLADYFTSLDVPFSFGDNNHTLVTASNILNQFDGIDDKELEPDLKELQKRAEREMPFGLQTLIDLEN